MLTICRDLSYLAISFSILTQTPVAQTPCKSGQMKIGLGSPQKNRYAFLFHESGELYQGACLTLQSIFLTVRKKCKLFGLIFGTKLTLLSVSIMRNTIKSKKLLSILWSLSCKSWRSDRVCILRIFHCFIRSRLDYGSTMYGSA